ncbi:hypothetical protein [Agarivorans albus]|uniref:Uncharacterized protein n=1 Tax=Agarivorans albus MKT 106 TaxID=1331007 RepID=R9PT30_AGAAL|nr:hypothetical protein [Agarivorans albus]GAD01706.1 hypothetical protein AALB_1786 [Agarivorans albus MKT 106]
MKQHLSNLDEILQEVRNTHTKNYLNEAIASYRTGAYRAALITTWIAVCVDVIEKVKELSLSDDPAAKKVNERLSKISPVDPAGMLAFEKDILNIACDELGLISAIEKSHLERLKNDRNVCAHPTFSDDGTQFSPLAELALSYIVQASNYLLVHAPVKGKVVIKRLFELINEPSFPSDPEKAFIVLSSDNNLGRAKESSVRNLCLILLKRVFKDKNTIPVNIMEQITSSILAIERLSPQIYKEVIDKSFSTMLSETADFQLIRVLPYMYFIDAWASINEAERVRIEELVSNLSIEDITKYRVVKVAESIPSLHNALKLVVKELTAQELYIFLSENPSALFKEQAIDLFYSSVSFDSAEMRGLNILIPMAEYFDNEDYRKIFSCSLNNKGAYGHNQILYAGDIARFFAGLYAESKKGNADYQTLWREFKEELDKVNITYPTLISELVKDKIIISNIKEEPKEKETQSI